MLDGSLDGGPYGLRIFHSYHIILRLLSRLKCRFISYTCASVIHFHLCLPDAFYLFFYDYLYLH
ncbi:hypothetical protein C8J56DRAFT_949007 [Mycena floridula]|nr:hypothetical protein C8J56DRAFT_949007 [Mycena floridula]